MGNSAIHKAAANNDIKTIEKLWNKKANDKKRLKLVNKKAPDGNTPLHYAVYYVKGDLLEAVQFLVEHGAKIDATDKDGDTPLHYACKYGKKQVAQYLLDKGSKAYTMVVSPQLVARAHGHFELSDMINEFASENSFESMQRKKKVLDRKMTMRHENIMNLFAKLDLDKNNLLSKNELMHFMTRFKERARQSIALDKLNEAIETFDVNKDGHIDRSEWIGFMNAFLQGFDEDYIHVICHALVKEPVFLDESSTSAIQLSWTGADVDVGVAFFDEQRLESEGSPLCYPKRPVVMREAVRHYGTEQKRIDFQLSQIPSHVHIMMIEVHSINRSKEWSSTLSIHPLDSEQKPLQHPLYTVSISPDDHSMGQPLFFLCRCTLTTTTGRDDSTCDSGASTTAPVTPNITATTTTSNNMWKIVNILPIYGPPYKKEAKSNLNSFEIFDNFLQKRRNVEMNIRGAVGRVRVISAKQLTPPNQGIMTSRYKITFMDKLIEMGKSVHMTVSPEWNGDYNTISYSKDCGGIYTFLFEVVDHDKMKEDNFMGQATLTVDLNKQDRVEFRNHELVLQPRKRTDVVTGSIFVDIDLRLKDMMARGSRHTCEHLDLENGSLNLSALKTSSSKQDGDEMSTQ